MDMDMLRQRLEGVGFPATKHDVMLWAREHSARTEELETLEQLPLDTFDSIQGLLRAASMARKT